jgi:hypothetical protein
MTSFWKRRSPPTYRPDWVAVVPPIVAAAVEVDVATDALVLAYLVAQLGTRSAIVAEAPLWANAVADIETLIAVRCVCGDPIAVDFIADRSTSRHAPAA